MFFWYYYSYCEITPSQLFLAFDAYTGNNPHFGNKTQDELDECQQTSQSIFFVALVLVQFFNLLSTRTQRLSFFQHNPFVGKGENRNLFLAIFVTVCFTVFVIYVPFMNSVFGTRPVPYEFWLAPLAFGVVLFCLDEIRKLIKRLIARLRKKSNPMTSTVVPEDVNEQDDEHRSSISSDEVSAPSHNNKDNSSIDGMEERKESQTSEKELDDLAKGNGQDTSSKIHDQQESSD